MNEAFLNFANTFSGGLFFGIGLFHLLNEGVEKLSEYSSLPWPYFLAAIGYSFILFIQKVIFGNIVPSAEQNLENPSLRTSMISKEKIGNIWDESNLTDESLSKIEVDLDNDENIGQNTLSKISEDIQKTEENLDLKRKKLSAFILLLSLSIHGLFECLTLGIQTNYKNTLFLFIALIIHKWAEAFALGILFVKAKFSKKFYYLIIILFAIIGPIAVGIGIVLSETTNELVEGIFLSISTGTFFYVSSSEVIIEEFSTPDKRYIKFFLYLFGCVLAAGLSLLEYLM